MEDSSKPETVPPGFGGMSAMSGPLLPASLEKLHSQTDSLLTAARLVRRGWTEEGKKTGWQVSCFDSSRRPSVSGSDGNQGPKGGAERGTGSEKQEDEAKRTESAFSANRQAERQTGLYRQTGIRILVSGCRTTFRQSRRFKAPILPVIAEI